MATEVKRKRGPVDRKAASLATKLYRQKKLQQTCLATRVDMDLDL